MSKTDTAETKTNEEVQNSRKREVTAVVTSTAMTVVLGVVANVLIGKASGYVSQKIAPKPE